MSKRQQFKEILKAREAHGRTLGALGNALQAEWDGHIKALWQEAFPRRKKFSLHRAEKDLGKELYEADYATYEKAGNEVHDAWKAEKDRLDALLEQLALELIPREGPDWNTYKNVSSYTYSAQGFGAVSYARNQAELHADEARFHGLLVKIEEKKHKSFFWCAGYLGGCSTPGAGFRVLVKADLTDLGILKRKPALSLREQVRLCWRRGANPRVFNPSLPHGYEEREGLDFFGNDLRKDPGQK